MSRSRMLLHYADKHLLITIAALHLRLFLRCGEADTMGEFKQRGLFLLAN